MKEFDLPQLPEGARYGAEHALPLPKDGEFHAPAGHAIKRIDPGKGIAYCVPIQRWVPETQTWYTIAG